MILPTKHITPERSLLGLGSQVLQRLAKPKTIVALWNEVRGLSEVATFERFILTLDFLYMLGAITLENGLLTRTSHD